MKHGAGLTTVDFNDLLQFVNNIYDFLTLMSTFNSHFLNLARFLAWLWLKNKYSEISILQKISSPHPQCPKH